jgi:hypothetical protein
MRGIIIIIKISLISLVFVGRLEVIGRNLCVVVCAGLHMELVLFHVS